MLIANSLLNLNISEYKCRMERLTQRNILICVVLSRRVVAMVNENSPLSRIYLYVTWLVLSSLICMLYCKSHGWLFAFQNIYIRICSLWSFVSHQRAKSLLFSFNIYDRKQDQHPVNLTMT